jgi:hypothetical protein
MHRLGDLADFQSPLQAGNVIGRKATRGFLSIWRENNGHFEGFG